MSDPALATPPNSSDAFPPPPAPHRPRFRFFRTVHLIGVVLGVALFAALGPVGLSVGLVKPGSIWNVFNRPASHSRADSTAHNNTHRKLFVDMAAEFNTNKPDCSGDSDQAHSEVIALLDRNLMAHSRLLIALAAHPQYGEETVTPLREQVELNELFAESAELTCQKALCEEKAQEKPATCSAPPFFSPVGL